MTFEEIDQLVRRANPVPDPGGLGDISAAVDPPEVRGRTTMQIQDLSERDADDTATVQRGGNGSHRRPLAALAAAALVVVALVGVSLVGGDDGGTDEPASGAASPIELADSFLSELAAYDAEGAAGHLTAAALEEAGGVDALHDDVRWREAIGWQWLSGGCEEVTSGPTRTILRCPFDYHAIHSDELGFPPFEGSSYRIVVAPEGQITSFTENMEYDDNRFSVLVFEPFHDWVSANHPGDVAVMFDESTGTFGGTVESIALWERRSREYVEAMREG